MDIGHSVVLKVITLNETGVNTLIARNPSTPGSWLVQDKTNQIINKEVSLVNIPGGRLEKIKGKIVIT